MRNYRKTNAVASKASYLKNSIAQTHGRSKFVGVLYLFGIIVLALGACLPMLVQELAPVGIFKFWKQFLPKNLKSIKTAADFVKFANSGLYLLMFIGVWVNVLRGLAKLNWLFKTKASKTYGFNRNVYAMEDLGRIFSGSFAVILVTYFIIVLACGAVVPNYLMFLILGGGLFAHVWLGFMGMKTAYYDLEDGDIVEEKREVGRFAPIVRNVIQLCFVFIVLFLFIKASSLHTVIGPVLEKNGLSNYVLKQPKTAWLSIGFQGLSVLCLFVLIKHATAITEYNIDGSEGRGMKVFRVFTFFLMLTTGATVLCRYIFGEITFTSIDTAVATGTSVSVVKDGDWYSLIIACGCLLMFIIELIMRKMPKNPNAEVENDAEEDEISYHAPEAQVSTAPQFPVQTQGHPSSLYVNVAPVMVLDTGKKAAEDEEKLKAIQAQAQAKQENEEPAIAEVTCPCCGRGLRVNTASEYHRCPACNKVFQLRKIKKNVIV